MRTRQHLASGAAEGAVGPLRLAGQLQERLSRRRVLERTRERRAEALKRFKVTGDGGGERFLDAVVARDDRGRNVSTTLRQSAREFSEGRPPTFEPVR